MVGTGPSGRPRHRPSAREQQQSSRLISSPRHNNSESHKREQLSDDQKVSSSDPPPLAQRSSYNLSPRGRSASWTLTFGEARTAPPAQLPSDEIEMSRNRLRSDHDAAERQVLSDEERARREMGAWEGGVDPAEFDKSRGDTPPDVSEVREGHRTPRSPVIEGAGLPIPSATTNNPNNTSLTNSSSNAGHWKAPPPLGDPDGQPTTKSQIILQAVHDQSFGAEYDSSSPSVSIREGEVRGQRDQRVVDSAQEDAGKGETKVQRRNRHQEDDSNNNKGQVEKKRVVAAARDGTPTPSAELTEVWSHLVAARNERERSILQEREQEVELVEARAIEQRKRMEIEAKARSAEIQRQRLGKTATENTSSPSRTFIRIVPNPKNPLQRHENSMTRLQSLSPSRSGSAAAQSRRRRRATDHIFNPDASGFDDSEVIGAEPLDESNSTSPLALSPLRPQRHISWVEQFSASKLKAQRERQAYSSVSQPKVAGLQQLQTEGTSTPRTEEVSPAVVNWAETDSDL